MYFNRRPWGLVFVSRLILKHWADLYSKSSRRWKVLVRNSSSPAFNCNIQFRQTPELDRIIHRIKNHRIQESIELWLSSLISVQSGCWVSGHHSSIYGSGTTTVIMHTNNEETLCFCFEYINLNLIKLANNNFHRDDFFFRQPCWNDPNFP